MMSPRLSSALLATCLVALAGHALADPLACKSSAPVSCQNTTAISNTCCTEVHGQVLQVQFWDSDPATGPSDSWTIHGLWPDNCDGSYPSNCDSSRAYTDISAILENGGDKGTTALDFMQTYWKDQGGDDETFWAHEWGKHGTCYSTLATKCFSPYTQYEEVVDFFSQTTILFQSLPTYDWLSQAGITPSSSKKYTTKAFLAALKAPRGVSAAISCSGGKISQVEYTFNVKGGIANGVFEPAAPVGESSSSCGTSFLYPPKNE
ncbi:ribonuclease Trv, RNase Trv [Myriangium duriaei CBS 260.36]|uniref:ribonuclease T2 n=1 Tax=Myriangium duriaei CBS 260.36 TaxID=1168546 RepID=A0A9P4IVR9_9PEZI|nr:ribonuclease Trv, RNase Trv [Myriangium duriaei CBS 260.36]